MDWLIDWLIDYRSIEDHGKDMPSYITYHIYIIRGSEVHSEVVGAECERVREGTLFIGGRGVAGASEGRVINEILE